MIRTEYTSFKPGDKAWVLEIIRGSNHPSQLTMCRMHKAIITHVHATQDGASQAYRVSVEFIDSYPQKEDLIILSADDLDIIPDRCIAYPVTGDATEILRLIVLAQYQRDCLIGTFNLLGSEAQDAVEILNRSEDGDEALRRWAQRPGSIGDRARELLKIQQEIHAGGARKADKN